MPSAASTGLERHRGGRAQWLRAAVLGADDGIVSSASLMLGVLSASGSRSAVLTAGVAGLVAGASSMAVGEYVSVGSQRDAEQADLAVERAELAADPAAEERELAQIYVERGLPLDLASQVAAHLSRQDALAAHARDELGLSPERGARPLQAAVVSAASFAAGAMVPVLAALLITAPGRLAIALVVSALVALVALGAGGARLGGAPMGPGMVRVGLGGAAAMAITALIGRLLGSTGI